MSILKGNIVDNQISTVTSNIRIYFWIYQRIKKHYLPINLITNNNIRF